MTPSTSNPTSTSTAFFLGEQPGSGKVRSLNNKPELELRLWWWPWASSSLLQICFLICKMRTPLPTSHRIVWILYITVPGMWVSSSLFLFLSACPWNFWQDFTILWTKKSTLRSPLNIHSPPKSKSKSRSVQWMLFLILPEFWTELNLKQGERRGKRERDQASLKSHKEKY